MFCQQALGQCDQVLLWSDSGPPRNVSGLGELGFCHVIPLLDTKLMVINYPWLAQLLLEEDIKVAMSHRLADWLTVCLQGSTQRFQLDAHAHFVPLVCTGFSIFVSTHNICPQNHLRITIAANIIVVFVYTAEALWLKASWKYNMSTWRISWNRKLRWPVYAVVKWKGVWGRGVWAWEGD